MVLGKLPVPGRPTILSTVGQGPIALAVGAGGGGLEILLSSILSSLSPSLWETARYRLKYCPKGPLNPNQPTNQLITIGQHFVTTRVVHLSKRTETSLITESDQSRANHQLLQLCTVRTAWSDSDQAVRAVHSCISRYCWRCWVWP